MALMLLAGAALAAFVALYPFTLYPASLRLLPERPIRRGPAPLPDTPVTLCFCAYNEERVIPAKLANLRELKAAWPGLRVLAYVDAATDRTAELLLAAPELVETVVGGERRGKTHGMNRLVARATSDIVVFTDANVLLDPTAIERLTACFADEEVGCVCGHLIYLDAEAAAARTNSLQWRLEEATKGRESATGSVMGADGSIFAVRRRLHRPVPDDLIDDMYLSFDILCRGHRVVHAADVLAYEASAADAVDECRRKIRIACQAFNVHRAIWPRLRQLGAVDRYKYVAHRFLRWLCPFLLVLALVLGLAGMARVLGPAPVALLALLAALAVALGLQLGVRPVAAGWSALLSLAGVGIGVLRSLAGQRFQTWQPAASVRTAAGLTPKRRKVLYLAHDLNDARVRLRAGELADLGYDLLVLAFRREKIRHWPDPPWPVVDLGTTRDYAYADRALRTLMGGWRLWRERRQLAGADLILARNLEPATLAPWARRLAGGHPPIVYEAMDVHRLLLGQGPASRALRGMERSLLRRVELLAVSSPAYLDAYFVPVQHHAGPAFLLENKLPAAVAAGLPRLPVAGSVPAPHVWTIGWFGMLRCMRSLELLTGLAELLPSSVRIVIRGVPTEITAEELERRLAGLGNVSFGGAYRNPEDLADLYGSVDLVWAVDCYDAGSNSDWLLPNRLYEAGFFNRPLVARQGTALGERIAAQGSGWTLVEPLDLALRAFFVGELTPEAYATVQGRMARLPRSLFVASDELAQLCAQAIERAQGGEAKARPRRPEPRPMGGLADPFRRSDP